LTVTPSYRRSVLVAAGAASVAGLALWLSRASFDVVGTADASQRVAMLPALTELAGLLVLAFLVTGAVASLLPRSGEHARSSDQVIDVFMPVFALALLAAPYLPWLPDRLPALRLLAGPGRALLWVVVLGQLAWLLLPDVARRFRQSPIPSVGPFAGSLLVFAVSLAVFAWALAAIGSGGSYQWLSLIAAGAVAAIVWIAAFAVSGSKAAATFGWASVCLSIPFVLNSHELMPEAFVDVYNRLSHLTSGNGNVAGVPGLLFDQEFGIAPYAPVLLLAFVGLAAMLRDSAVRRIAVILIVPALLLVLVGSLGPWWSESMMPGRPVLLLFPLLAPPIAWLYERTAERPLQRAGMRTLLLVSIAVTLASVVAIDHAPLPQEGDGSSSLLQWMSPTWDVWNAAPSYVAGTRFAAFISTATWLVAFTLVGLLLSRKTAARAGSAALLSTTAGVVAILASASVNAALRLDDASQPFSPEGRVLLPMLETFDPVARPIGVKYDPMSVVRPDDLAPLFSLSAVPGERRNRQPLRVVLNARFRLPAGQYQVDITGSSLAGSVPDAQIGLQIGREGRPLETWPLPIVPGSQSHHRFSVPVDAEFVGFRASRQLERTISELRLRALEAVGVKRRLRTPTVRSSADFDVARVFFHDPAAYPEREGFWVRGRTTAHVTILNTSSAPSVTLALHSGARPNVVTLSTSDWSQRIELVPGTTTKTIIPANPDEPLIAMSIEAENGFVPAEVDSSSKDRRLLGAWIAFIPADNARTSGAP
jgi:hypothetical protein